MSEQQAIPRTGHPGVDAVLAALGDEEGLPPAVLLERCTVAHEGLHAVLTGSDQAPLPGAGPAASRPAPGPGPRPGPRP